MESNRNTIKLRNMTSLFLMGEEEVLCLYRIGSRVVGNQYIGSAGGHFEPAELNDPSTCVLRELKEELGLDKQDLVDFRLRYITLRLTENEVRQNYYFFAKLAEKRELTSTEGTLHWISFRDVPELDMPVSAKHMLMHYLKVGRFDDAVYAGITERTGTAFVPMRSF